MACFVRRKSGEPSKSALTGGSSALPRGEESHVAAPRSRLTFVTHNHFLPGVRALDRTIFPRRTPRVVIWPEAEDRRYVSHVAQ